ncbi:SHOCT domain-containing protein [Thermasporomyces composti]|jgi:putative membrane protein|uniref:Putative membrane protein n=1 Tax=Thermasporomyces composti TaxID=696763 RepID=A0A3D9V749_THECX|nr:SHOCT domain-containing protein [Thermasporomyces composti]REF37618.1 putative membrane protein [Thermasporomyces composti]
MHGYGWGLAFGWFLVPLFWIALIALIAWLVVKFVGPGGLKDAKRGDRGESAEEILNRRYASGEIDTATYEEMKERLVGRR